jgi:uncharacterized iron-regulated membrane protein
MADGRLGQQAASSTYSLHFGDYGGLTVKLAYVLFGGALTGICGTGVSIWLGKRRRRGHHEPRLARMWDAIIWGTPTALGVTLAARLVFGNSVPFAALFWGALATAVAAGAAPLDPLRFRRGLQALTAIAVMAPFLLALR